MAPKERISLQLPDALNEWLEQTAAEAMSSKSAIVRQVLEQARRKGLVLAGDEAAAASIAAASKRAVLRKAGRVGHRHAVIRREPDGTWRLVAPCVTLEEARAAAAPGDEIHGFASRWRLVEVVP